MSPRRHIEDSLQMSLVRVLKQFSKVLFFHVPNGGFRNVIEAARLKAMGVMPGVADLIFVMPPHATMYALELKAPKKKPRDSQLEFKERVIAAGGKYEYADNMDVAIHYLKEWGVL